MNMTSSQPSAQSATNYKEAFSLFDKRGNGRVSLDALGDLLRACGQNPTLAEIREQEKTVGGDCKHLDTNNTAVLTGAQLTSIPSAKSSTDLAVSEILVSPRNTAVAFKFSTKI